MRHWLVLVLFLLGLGTLRVVACGEDAPEPCESASDCDDHDRCTVDRCVNGECFYKPEDCVGDAECTHVCDPERGCHEPNGTDCCLERDYCDRSCLEQVLGSLFCERCCVESGQCIDGFCRGWDWVEDCTGEKDWTPCGSQGYCIDGVCGEPGVCGDVVVDFPHEDCDGINLQGFDCTDFGGHTGGTLACTVDCSFDFSGCTGPEGWTCSPFYYGTADWCDCGCGILDPDCIDATVASCSYCNLSGSCSQVYCPGDIDPTQNWLCLGTGGSGGTSGGGGFAGGP